MKFWNWVKGSVTEIVLAVLGAIAMDYGTMLKNDKSIQDFGISNILCLAVYFAIFLGINKLLFNKLKHREEVKSRPYQFSKKSFFILWAVIFLCWVPVFLAYFPTMWNYDVFAQIPYTTGDQITTHHPILHTLFLNGTLEFGHSIGGTYEFGMVLLSIAQMLIVSCAFAYVVEKVATWLPSKKHAKIVKILLVIFLGIVPYNSIMALSMTKDTIFTAFIGVMLVKMYDIIDKRKLEKKDLIILGIASVFMMLFRNNGVYAFALFLILALFAIPKGFKKKLAAFGCSLIIIYLGLNFALVKITGAAKGTIMEMFSLPLQSINGTIVRHQDELLPEYGSGQQLLGLASRDDFPEDFEHEAYDPHCADPAKNYTWTLVNDKTPVDIKALLTKWVELGFKYPLDYVDIYGNLMLGAWYPLDTSHAHIYHGRFYLLTGWNNYNVDVLGIDGYRSKLPALYNALERIAGYSEHENLPIISLFFAPATYTWLLIFAIGFLIKSKRRLELIPLLFLFSLFATVLLGPCVIVRYMYPLMVAAPLILIRLIYHAPAPEATAKEIPAKAKKPRAKKK